jgi:hypothetical protein
MDGDTLRTLFSGINLLLVMALAAYTYLGDKDKVTTARLGSMESAMTDRFQSHGERISRVETEVDGHPTHADVAALYASINSLAAIVNRLVGETQMQSDLLRMLINREVSNK